jgi:nucleoside phosphorylase
MAREIRPLVRGWKLERNARGVTVYSSERAVAVVAGMGRGHAEIATDTAFNYGPIHQIVSVGLAGGLHSSIAAGSVYVAEKIVDGASGEVFDVNAEKTLEPIRRAMLVTAD